MEPRFGGGAGMRWIIAATLTGILVGMCGGLGLGLSVGRTEIVEAGAAPLAPQMSVARFMQCSEVNPDALSVSDRLREYRRN
jgi:hypothetical protein